MKVSDLLEDRAPTDKGYITPGYDAERKHHVGTVVDWMARIGVDEAGLKAAHAQAEELPSYKELTAMCKDITTAREAKNGTFAFSKPNADDGDRYIVYANGLIRSQADTSAFSDTQAATRMKSPKPRLKAGDPVKSVVMIYDGAFKELCDKAQKRAKATK